jgi:hypothetical protein
MFHRDQEVGASVLEVDEKRRFAFSASTFTGRHLSSTRTSSSNSAEILPPTSVA